MAGGRVAGWPYGRLAGWPGGRLAGGRLAGWPGDRVAGWPWPGRGRDGRQLKKAIVDNLGVLKAGRASVSKVLSMKASKLPRGITSFWTLGRHG